MPRKQRILPPASANASAPAPASGIREKLKWLDPFTYVDEFAMPRIKEMPAAGQWLVFAFTFFALMYAVFSFFGGGVFVAAILALFYLYLIFFERESAIEWGVYAFSAFFFALILYNVVLVGLLGTSFPLMIVYSGSMEPVLYRGDVVILMSPAQTEVAEVKVDFPLQGKPLRDYAEVLVGPSAKFGVRQSGISINGQQYQFDSKGPIVVYASQLQKKEIIHRAVLKLVAPDGNFLITFGDNNNRIDADCPAIPSAATCINPYAVPRNDLRGKYLFHIPLVGYAKLLIFDDLPNLLLGKGG